MMLCLPYWDLAGLPMIKDLLNGVGLLMNKPNIILIVSDQHRSDFMGCAGKKVVETPTLDKMAAEGIHFTNHYCNSPLCVPSRMSMMTGRHPHHTGVFGNEDCLPSDMPTFAHALALGGYETILCGRMHFVGPDQRHGFQRRLVGDITPSYAGGPKTNYGPLGGTTDSDFISIKLAGPGNSPVMNYDETVTSASEQFLLERAHSPGSCPFFLTIGLYGPHNPYTCSHKQYERAVRAMELHDKTIPVDPEPHPWIEETLKNSGLDKITDQQMNNARANYIGLVNHLDQYIGRILKASQALGEDTLIIYVSDHGDMAGDHGLFWKRCFYEASVKVPMIWYPAVSKNGLFNIKKGMKIDVPTSLVDLAPTLISLSGSSELPNLDGRDLLQLIHKNEISKIWTERPVFSELIIPSKSPTRMIRYKEYKLIYYHGYSSPQLFNVVDDPDEKYDLSRSTSHQDIKEELLCILLKEWNVEEILRKREKKLDDLKYMKLWGNKVGMGRLDLWNEDYTLNQAR